MSTYYNVFAIIWIHINKSIYIIAIETSENLVPAYLEFEDLIRHFGQ